MVGLKFLFTSIFLFPFFSWSLDLKTETKLSAKKVELGDRVILSIEITSNQKQIAISNKTQSPVIEGLDFLNRSISTSTSMSFVNGKSSVAYTQILNLFFTPTRTGRIQIPKIPILVEGQKVFSKPIVLQVVKELPRKKQNRGRSINPFDDMDSIFNQFFGRGRSATPAKPEFFVDIELGKTNPYEGEQFLVKWYIYTNGSLSQFDTLKFPTLKGFWKEDVEFAQNFRWERVEYKGKAYRRALMSSYALTPYKAGMFVIDPFELRATVSSSRLGFGRPKVFKVKSQKYEIDVQPLPEPKPKTFSGGVGNFTISLDSFPQQAFVGEAFPVTVRIRGNESNAKFIKTMDLDLRENEFEAYEKKEEVKFFPSQLSYIKKVDYLILPKQEGKFIIPDLQITYFDTELEKYESKYVQFPLVEILASNKISVDDVLIKEDVDRQTTEKRQAQFIKDLPLSARLISPSYKFFIWILLFWLIMSFITFFVVLLRKRDQKVSFLESLQAESLILEDEMKSHEYKKALERMINLISLGVGALSGRRFGVEKTFLQSLDELPVSLQKQKKDFADLNTSLQSVRFGRVSVQDRAQVEKCYEGFLKFKDIVVEYLDKD